MKQKFSQSIGFCYLNTSEFLKSLYALMLEWLDQRFQNFFNCDPNLIYVNTS